MGKTNFTEAEIIEYLQKIVNTRFTRFILKELTDVKRIEKSLGIYVGVEEAHSLIDRTHARLLGKVLEEGAEKFGVEKNQVKESLRDPYMRKGFAVILRSIAEYGITKPQKLVAPFMVVWDFTKMCNLKCKHCYANASASGSEDELTLEEKYEVVDQLDNAGVAAISFSGGEPLLDKDFWKVAKYAKQKGFYLSVATNGTLINEAIAKRLKEVGVRYVEISLDAPTPDIHDEFRGVDGAFNLAVRGIRNSKKVGLSTGIATTITKRNLDYVGEMIQFARSLNVDRFIVFNFIPTGRGREIMEEDLSPREREDLMNLLYEEWQKGGMQIFSTCPAYARVSITGGGRRFSPTHFAELEFPPELSEASKALAEFIGGCGAGRIYCSIEHNGDIQPCVFIPITVGNVLRDGFINVWKNNEILRSLRDRDAPDYACSSCAFRYVCGGCRARAYVYFNNLKAADPGCILRETEWVELIHQF